MIIERKRYVVMRNDRSEIWAGNARNYSFRELKDAGHVNIVTYSSKKKALASCSSCNRDFEVVPIIETLDIGDTNDDKKDIPFDKSFEQMLISAERYAFGRRTYIVSDTVNYILSLLPFLSDWCVTILFNDIDREFETAKRCDNDYRHFGDACDLVEWKKLYKELTIMKELRNLK